MLTVWLRRVWSVLAAFALICSLPALANAQAVDPDSDARAIYDEGRVHFEAGEFDEAAHAFRRAFVLTPRYPLLYNIGQADLRAGHDAQALEAFEGYLRQAPEDAPQRGEVEERVRVLRGMGVVPAGPGAATSAPIEAPAPRGSTSADPTPWIIAGVGGAVAIAGVVLLVLGITDADSVTGASDGTRWMDLEGPAGRANTEFAIGLGLMGVGAAALGVGIVWGATTGGSGSESTSVALRIGPGSLNLAGTF